VKCLHVRSCAPAKPFRVFVGLVSLTVLLSAQTAPQRPHSAAPPALAKIQKEAEAARQANQVDEAIALYKKAVALEPAWDEGWWYLGSLYYDLDQYREGQGAFTHLTAIKPKNGAAWVMLGLCEFQTSDYKAALDHLGQGLGIGLPQDDQLSDVAHYHFAILLTRYEQYEEAMHVLTVFAQRNLNQPDFVEAMGIAAMRKPLLPKELPPTEREIVMDVGRAMYDAAGLRARQAAGEFRILLAKYPDVPNIHYLYGSFLLFSDPDAGVVELKKELEASPDHVPDLVTLAAEYIRRQDFAAALPYAEKAVSLDPQFFAAHTVLGRALVEGDSNVARGLQELEMARRLAPNSPQVHIALATAYTKAGRKEDAAREREEFLRLRKLSETGGAGSQ